MASHGNTNWDIWFAGAFAALTCDFIVYPLDTIKTRIQSPSYPKNYPTNRALYRGLYQGIGSVILVTIPSSGAFFTTYETLKYFLNDSIPPNSTLFLPQPAVHAIASGGAELVSCAILTPAEVLKQNAQIVIKKPGTKRHGSPTLEVLRQFRQHPTHLWRGYTALAARNLPFTGLQFPAFEYLKTYFLAQRRRQKGGGPVDGILERASITALSAGLAGSAAAWITTPIDVVKTRIMLSAGDETRPQSPHNTTTTTTTNNNKRQRRSGLQIFRDILKAEGLRGIFRGAALRCIWTAFGSGLYLGCYEGGRFFLEDRRRRNEGDLLMSQDSDRKEGEEKEGEVRRGVKKVVRRQDDGEGTGERKVGVGVSRSQGERIGKSGWQD